MTCWIPRLLAIKRFQPDVVYRAYLYPVQSAAALPCPTGNPIVYDEGGAGCGGLTEHGRWFRFTVITPPNLPTGCPQNGRSYGWWERSAGGRIQPHWQAAKHEAHFQRELNRRVAANAGVPVEQSTVIHSGVDTNLFTFRPAQSFERLYASSHRASNAARDRKMLWNCWISPPESRS